MKPEVPTEAVKLYRNWCRQHRFLVGKCVVGYSVDFLDINPPWKLTVWICFETDVVSADAKEAWMKKLRSLNEAVRCFCYDRNPRTDPGDIVVFHDKSLVHYNNMVNVGNMILEDQ
jgi:hypothetical protein